MCALGWLQSNVDFYCIGGVRICDHHLPHAVQHIASHRVDQVVDCGLWNVGPLLFNCWAKLLDIGRNWNTLSYKPIQCIPNMLNGWHVRWVCWPCKNWDVFSFQELCTDPCNMGPCIIMLHHEVMVVDEWHNNGPQDLVTISLCIQNAFNKMHLCSLSITYACPYHNTQRHHGPLEPQRWHQQTTHPHDAIHAVCHLPCTVKTGIHPWREHLSKVPDAIECEHLPTQVGYDDKLQSGRDPDEDDVHADELLWDGFWQFLTEIIWFCKPIVAAAVRVFRRSWRWRCWMWRSWAGVVTHGLQLWGWLDVLPNSLKHLWRRLMVEKLTFNSRGNSSGGHSFSQHANCMLPQNLRHLWHCAVWLNCKF